MAFSTNDMLVCNYATALSSLQVISASVHHTKYPCLNFYLIMIIVCILLEYIIVSVILGYILNTFDQVNFDNCTETLHGNGILCWFKNCR